MPTEIPQSLALWGGLKLVVGRVVAHVSDSPEPRALGRIETSSLWLMAKRSLIPQSLALWGGLKLRSFDDTRPTSYIPQSLALWGGLKLRLDRLHIGWKVFPRASRSGAD